VDAQESVGEDAAAEIGAQLPLDEAGHGPALAPGPPEEGLQLLAHDLVQQGRLGLVPLVLDGAGSAGRGVRRRRRKSRAAPRSGSLSRPLPPLVNPPSRRTGRRFTSRSPVGTRHPTEELATALSLPTVTRHLCLSELL
jgi:hypothetical protein